MSSNVKRDHHNLRRNLKTNGNAIEHNSTSAHDILKTNGMVVAEKNAAGQITFNPDEVTSGIKITGQTTFAKTSEEGHAIKVQASGTTDTGGRLALTGVYSSNDFKEQVNGIVDFAQTPVTAEAHGLATGGFIKNLTKGLANQNATNAVTMGGILGIKGGTTTTVGAVSVVPLSVSGTWVNDSSGTIVSQTSVVNSSGGASDGTGAQLFIVTAGGVPRVSLVMNQAISPRIATNTVVFDRETHTINLGSLVEYDWVTLGFVASHEFTNTYGRANRAGSVITISGTANNNGTYIIKSFDSTRRIATVESNLNADFSSDDWQYVSISDFPLTDETLSSSGSTVATILGGGSGKNYGFRDVLTFTDPDAGSSSTLTVQVETGCGDYPSYTTFGTCGDDKFLASERMRITSDGNVGIGTKAPQNFFAVQPTLYNTGWAMQSADADPSANGRTLHGFGTTWTADMVGKHFVFSNGYYAGKIETWSSSTKMVLSTATSSEVNVKRQAYNILHFGLQVTNTGLVIGEIVNTDSGNGDNLANQASLQYQGVTGASQTINNIGSDININSNLTAAGGTLAINAAGIIKNTGIDLDIASGTSGTQSAIGIDIGITGGADSDSADSSNNIGMQITQVGGNHIKLLKDANDYATIAVADTGDLTIATVGDGTTDSDLTLDIDGDIELNADGGDIVFKDASDTLATINGDGLTLNNITAHASGDNYLVEDSGVVKRRTAAQTLSDIGAQASLTFGIADTNAVKIDSGSVNDNEYARFTANGLEGRTGNEVISDLGLLPLSGGTMTGNILHAGNFSIDVEGDLTLDANGGNISLLDDGSTYTPTAASDAVPLNHMPYVLYTQFQDDMGTTKHYLPLKGYFEQSFVGNEPAGMIVPFNVKLQKAVMRCSQDISGATWTLGMWALSSGTSHSHHHTNGMNWASATGGAADANATFDFTGTVGLASSSSGGSNAVTAGQWIDFALVSDTDVTSSSAEFWITLFFIADLSNTI